jgi:hypothetical protein
MDLIHGGSVGNRHRLVNMWWTVNAFQYLIVNNLQEWLNPGYLKRRQERERGIEFLWGPA